MSPKICRVHIHVYYTYVLHMNAGFGAILQHISHKMYIGIPIFILFSRKSTEFVPSIVTIQNTNHCWLRFRHQQAIFPVDHTGLDL
jgi:hypothetical protein